MSDGRPIENIGWWDGRKWQNLAFRGDAVVAGVPGPVNAMAVRKSSLFVGGEFAGGLMEWRPPSLEVVYSSDDAANVLNGPVKAMISTRFLGPGIDGNDELWLVGNFNGIPGLEGELPGYAYYNGSYYGVVNALAAPEGASAIAEAESGDAIYFGGPRFDVEGLGTTTGVLYFGGFTGVVSSLGNGVVGVRQIDAILAANGLVYVAGDFDGVAYDGAVVPNTAFLAAWDGRRWISVGVFDGPVRSLAAVRNGELGAADVPLLGPAEVWIGGDFRTIDGDTYNGLSRRVGRRWSKVGGIWPGVAGDVGAIAQFGSAVWLGGAFAAVNTGRSRSVAALVCVGTRGKRVVP